MELPLAAEESHDPKKDMPKGLLLGILTLCISATLVTFLNSSIPVTDGTRSGAFYLGTSGEPILDGFRVTIPGLASVLSLLAVVGLIAMFALPAIPVLGLVVFLGGLSAALITAFLAGLGD